jgi:hypothetical protein
MLISHQLKNPSVFQDKSYVNGEWVEAKSGKRFDITGLLNPIIPLRLSKEIAVNHE